MTDLAIPPTAIDALVHIEHPRVTGRHRFALGDLDALAASIADVGLLNPITLTRDGRVVAGHRRLEACRRLGYAQIPVRFIDSREDAARLLRAERDENTCRKEMLPSELASLGEALYSLESVEAKERQREAGRTNGRGIASASEEGSYREDRRETAAVVGEALGMSDTTYRYLRSVYRAATDADTPEPERVLARAALDRMDRTGVIQPIAKEFRAHQRAHRDAQEAKAAALGDPEPAAADKFDPNWIPPRGDSSPRAVAQRRTLIRDLAGKGHSSAQIGDRLGIAPGTVRHTARDQGITIAADAAMGRGARRIDSNRVVRETVSAAENLGTGLDLIDFDDLDQAEIANWTTSLSKSIGVLNRLNKRLKEMAQ